MTEKERYTKALKRLEKCSGDCKNCMHCKLEISQNALYYAFYCDIVPELSPISNTMKNLKSELIDALNFEIS